MKWTLHTQFVTEWNEFILSKTWTSGEFFGNEEMTLQTPQKEQNLLACQATTSFQGKPLLREVSHYCVLTQHLTLEGKHERV
jgi:hypothetical protein